MNWFAFFKRLFVRRATTVPDFTPLSLRALEEARLDIGHGEEGGNNTGYHVRKYRGGDGTGKKINTRQAWCASFISWAYGRSVASPLPFKTSRGARRLTKNIGKAGNFIKEPRIGAVICWNRGTNPRSAWMAHIAFISDWDPDTDTIKVIEGNFGPYPALVTERTIRCGLWRKRLYRMALV